MVLLLDQELHRSSYSPPWWQFFQAPAYGFVMGALFMLLAASFWRAVITDDDQRVEHIILGAVLTLGAIGFLGSATVQLRRGRREPHD